MDWRIPGDGRLTGRPGLHIRLLRRKRNQNLTKEQLARPVGAHVSATGDCRLQLAGRIRAGDRRQEHVA